jgi:hypothetical protein
MELVQPTKKVFTATIHIAVDAENEGEACDIASELLTNHAMGNAIIIDWQYQKHFAQKKDIFFPLEEGDLFK